MSLLTQQHTQRWEPPATWSREQVLATSDAVLAKPAGEVKESEDIFRLSALGLDWDIGVRVYEPQPASQITRGADGNKVGIFLLHGGAGDYKSMEKFALLFAEKFGCKVVTMTFPGRLYLDDESRDWPGDTIHADGTVRTPIWQQGEHVTPDQYELVKDTGKRMKYGTRTSARAKPGSRFYDRMASWPVAFEEGMKEACRRHFPVGEFSVYVHGHSTGGPYVSMLTQRVPNIAGVIAIENSSFGYINEKKHQWGGHVGKIEGFQAVAPKSAESWKDPFNDLYIRTWRDLARYRGSEALGQEGPQALMRLPWLMEEILDAWDVAKKRPQFKAEYMITHNIVGALEQAARAAAARLKLSDAGDGKAGRALPRLYARTQRAGGQAGAALSVRDLEGQPRPQPGSLSRGHHPDVPGDAAGAARCGDALRRRRPHLHQARTRPAGRHRAGGRAVLS